MKNLIMQLLSTHLMLIVDHSMYYSISKTFEAMHADIADLGFLAKSADDPKYCLLIVDLFTSKLCVYPMKNRSLLAKNGTFL